MTLSYVNTLVASHNYLLIDNVRGDRNVIQSYKSPEVIMEEYEARSSDDLYNITVEGIKKALNVKLENESLASLLLATGDKVLVYADYNDPILGVGKQREGLNVTGVELAKLRGIIREERRNILPAIVEVKQAPTLMELTKSKPIMDWFEFRAKDVVQSIKYFMSYIGITLDKLTPPIVNFVVYTLYKNCNTILDKYSEYSEYPKTFETMIKSYFGSQKVPKSIIKILWKYMSFLTMHMVSEYIKNPRTVDIQNLLVRINNHIAESTECKGPFMDGEISNCAISAVLNIILKLKKYNNDRQFKVGLNELTLAFNLISSGSYVSADVVDVEELSNNQVMNFFRDHGVMISTDIARRIRTFVNNVEYNQRVISRIYFFNEFVKLKYNTELFRT
jgi:hypothetical protein